MSTRTVQLQAAPERDPNGGAMASFLGAGIGSLAMGLVVLLNEVGALAVPSVYGPAGGVSGRTTLATIVWLVAWGILHSRWRAREIASGRVFAVTVTLTALGILATFPPFWGLL